MARDFLRGLAAQLSRPTGLRGRLLARRLDRGNRSMIAGAVDLAAPAAPAAQADLGFGGGVGLRLLLDRVGPYGRVHGIDLAPDMVARAERRLRDPITLARLCADVGSLDRLPLPVGGVDVAITVNTIHFVPDLDAVARELRRISALGGRVVVTMDDPDPTAQMPFTAYGFTVRAADEVRPALGRAGFATVEVHRGGNSSRKHILLVALT